MVALYNELREGLLQELNKQGILSTADPDYQNRANQLTTQAVNLLKESLCDAAVAKLKLKLGVELALRDK